MLAIAAMGEERSTKSHAGRAAPLIDLDAIPRGRHIQVPGPGELFVREAQGPVGAPVLVLLHGWCATGGLNWFRAFRPLSQHFHVLAPDLRGHGRGPRTWRPFQLEDCADDVAALLRHVGSGPAIVAGYSMGGPVAQLLWKQHRPLVSGLVLCATSDRLISGLAERLALRSFTSALAGATRVSRAPVALPRWIVRSALPEAPEGRARHAPRWAAREARRHDFRMLLEAGTAISRYDATSWSPEIQVPTAVLLTLEDRLVSKRAQEAMTQRIPAAKRFPVNDGHLACTSEAFPDRLLEACLDVKRRVERAQDHG